jgi:hypothetical protein
LADPVSFAPTMRTRLTVSMLAVLTACGSSSNSPDAPPGTPPDGSTTVDACVGHTCGGSGSAAITDPEGGNIIFEHMTLDTDLQGVFKTPAGVNTQTRVIAYFMNAQTPDSNPLPMAGSCSNLVTTKGWPAYVGSPHTDIDVGTLTITGKNAAGTDVTMDIPKQAKGTDQIGRPHDVFYQFLQPKVDDLLKPDSFYTVKFGGVTGGMPATTFTDGIYLAADYTSVQSPGIEDNGPLIAGTDFPVAWTPGNSANKPADLFGGDVLGATWLLDVTGAPTHVCIVPASAGHFTIPGATITEYKAAALARGLATNKLIMLRNAIGHQILRLPSTDANNKRRIDMVTLECWAQVMDVQ